MHLSCLYFVLNSISLEEIKGKRILEVGSQNVNGSVRPAFSLLQPEEYIGVDFQEGSGVDVVCDARDVLQLFGEKSFDIVVSTEMFEHVIDWKTIVSNLKDLLKDDGLLFITTRSKGFKYHAYPYDFWRYELADFNAMFSDMEIIKLENDTENPGVFIKAKKLRNFKETDLSSINLYSMIYNRRIPCLSEENVSSTDFQQTLRRVKLKLALRGKLKNILFNIGKIIQNKMDALRLE